MFRLTISILMKVYQTFAYEFANLTYSHIRDYSVSVKYSSSNLNNLTMPSSPPLTNPLPSG